MTIYDSPPSATAKKTSAFFKPRWLRLNSIGTQLFLAVTVGSVIGLGVTAVLFYQTLEQRTVKEISDLVNTEVSKIEGKFEGVKFFTRGLGGAVKIAKNTGEQDPEAYKPLVLDFFLQRPELAMAAFFIQKPYGIVSNVEWYAPYYYLDQKAEGQLGERLPAPNNNIIYSELFRDDNYPIRDYYKSAIAAEKDIWIEPYPWYGITMTSFYTPIFNEQGKMIAFSGVDVNVTQLTEAIAKSVFEKQGYFIILSEKGNLLSYPPDPDKAKKIENYDKIPNLQKIWSRLQSQQSGVLRESGSYWVYQRIPSNQWTIVGVVPESVVIEPILRITLVGTLGAGFLLASIVALFVGKLNRRLQPILDECNKLAATDAQTQAQIEREDEIGRLSVSFFNLIDRLATKEEQIRQEVARTVQTEEQLKQSTEAQKEGEALAEDVGQLLDVVAAVEDGDLTVQAPVNERLTGLVSDTFNRLIEQLAQVLGQVANTAQQVTLSSQQLDESAQTVSFNVQQQAQDITNVLTLTEQVQSSARSSANQIDLANQSLTQVKTTIEQGQLAINALTEGIQTLQTGASQIVTRTHDLDEFVSLTNQFVQEQGQLAELIQSLAMGATLLSARATAQQDPRQMTVLAKEFETIANQIKGLAEQTNQNLGFLRKRTDKMQGTVTSIAQNLQDIDGLVNNFTQEVKKSTEAFSSIQSATESAIATGEAVSQSSQAIVQTAQTTTLEMGDIARLAEQTAQLTQTARSQSAQMGQISEQLLKRIQFFKLPEESSERADLSKSHTSTVDVTPTLTST